MTHEMKISESPFERIKKGIKTLEIRLYDQKRQQIKIGDTIEFTKLPEMKEKLTVKVTGLLIYSTFSEMLSDLPPSLLGYKESDREYLKTSMYEIYNPIDEKLFGALGIRIKLI